MNFSISCDDCSMQCSDACDECVVTFVLRTESELDREPNTGLLLDPDEQQVLHWFANAGLVPELKYSTSA